MTEEETFKKKYPEYCCGKSLLSPYWDLWQDGAEFGYNKALEWHDLEKDPTDLPKDFHNVWCQSYGGEYEVGWYEKDTEYWTLIYSHYYTKHIKAWCELPKREVE